MKVKDITILSILTAILFVQEQVLNFIPNVQFTFFLIILYSKMIKTRYVLIIVIIHIILDSLFMGAFNILYMLPMLIGYSLIPISLSLFFKRINNEFILGFLGIIYSLIYCMLFLFINSIIGDINILSYFVADIPFEIILAFSTFLSIIWLYKPIKNRITNLLDESIKI